MVDNAIETIGPWSELTQLCCNTLSLSRQWHHLMLPFCPILANAPSGSAFPQSRTTCLTGIECTVSKLFRYWGGVGVPVAAG